MAIKDKSSRMVTKGKKKLQGGGANRKLNTRLECSRLKAKLKKGGERESRGKWSPDVRERGRRGDRGKRVCVHY